MYRILVLLLAAFLFTETRAEENDSDVQNSDRGQLFKSIDLSVIQHLKFDPKNDSVIIAVVDDGFNVSHQDIAPFLWKNEDEIANNGRDDDLNGYIDDVHGWDISDMNESVSPPSSAKEAYYHGTFSASVIAQILHAKLGSLDDYPIKLMLVKAISDKPSDMLVRGGYKGIDYAVSNGADIISNSWSGGVLDTEAFTILNNARNKQAFIVNTVGNFPSAETSEPASHPAVFGVAGVALNGRIIEKSNYGEEVDLSAIGENVWGASVLDNTDYLIGEGTSVAAPMVAATAALMKLANTSLSSVEISACLKNTAMPIDSQNPSITGKLGAGLLQVDAAIDCAQNVDKFYAQENHRTPEGSIGTGETKGRTKTWTIAPTGDYAGLSFENSLEGKVGSATIAFYSNSDTHSGDSQKPLWSGPLAELPNSLGVDESNVRVEVKANNLSQLKFRSDYKAVIVDTEKRFCSGRVEISEPILFSDGSNDQNYVPRSDCEWLIAAKEGQSIHLEFTQLDIDLSDKIYLFTGDQKRQRDLLATISGDELPPKMIIKHGQALLWFVSENQDEAPGFAAKVTWEPVITDIE